MDMENIRTNQTGSDWRDAYERREELTTAQRCRYNQDINDPRRVYFCGRCGHASGSYQVHYWQSCRKDPDSLSGLLKGKPTVEFHRCCPDSCELTDPDPNPVQPCHPHPDRKAEWVQERLAELEDYSKWRTMLNERGHL